MLLRGGDESDDERVVLATTDGLPGYEIEDVIGLVAGYASDREGALRLMEGKARELGANAVLAVRIDSSASGGAFVSSLEAFAYGTAVRAAPAGR